MNVGCYGFLRCYVTADSGCVFPDVDAPPLPSVLAPPSGDSNKTGNDVNKHKDYVAKQQQELPAVDEDDYLQPKSSNPAPYMDIIPDTKGVKIFKTTSV